jgi:hypothetical protein
MSRDQLQLQPHVSRPPAGHPSSLPRLPYSSPYLPPSSLPPTWQGWPAATYLPSTARLSPLPASRPHALPCRCHVWVGARRPATGAGQGGGLESSRATVAQYAAKQRATMLTVVFAPGKASSRRFYSLMYGTSARQACIADHGCSTQQHHSANTTSLLPG